MSSVWVELVHYPYHFNGEDTVAATRLFIQRSAGIIKVSLAKRENFEGFICRADLNLLQIYIKNREGNV